MTSDLTEDASTPSATTPPMILVVEDEPLVQDLIQCALEDGGFAVQVAATGQAAVDILEKGPTLKGLITDIRLGGGVDGWAVARRARELNPDLAVIYTTGDSEIEWTSRGVPRSTLIAKPFAPMQLVVALATLVNEVGTPG